MSIRFRKDRNKWEVSSSINGKRIARQFETKKEASEFNRDVQLRKLGMDGIRKPYTIEDAFVNWLETESIRKTTQSQAADKRLFEIARHYFEKTRGLRLMSEVAIDDLQRFESWAAETQTCGLIKKEGWSDTTIARQCALLKSVFRKAFFTKHIGTNVAEFWRIRGAEGEMRRAMTKTEFNRLYQFAPEWFRPILAFIRLTGARGASVATLEWSDVDFEKAILYLISRKGAAKKRKQIPIPMYPELASLMASVRNQPPAILETLQGNNKVFLDENHVPITPGKIASVGHRLIKRAGLKDVTIYGLRHAIAVELTDAGVPTDIIRKAMGHDSIRTTQHYAERAGSSKVAEALKQIRSVDDEGEEQPNATENSDANESSSSKILK